MEQTLVPILNLIMILQIAQAAVSPVSPHLPTPVVEERFTSDADGDGVGDGDDLCPGTGFAHPVDTNGCALDSDEDGVDDGHDRCPGTLPEAYDVDESGCSTKDRKTERPYRFTTVVG